MFDIYLIMFSCILFLLLILNSFMFINCKQNYRNAQRLYDIEYKLNTIIREGNNNVL